MVASEIWKDVVGYEGHYQVSNLGNVRSIKSAVAVILKGDVQRNGYKRVYLWLNGGKKNLLVHRLVAEAFIKNPRKLSDVNHIDENKTNNCASNLQWCTHLYNMNYGTVKSKIGSANAGKVKSPELRARMSKETSNRRWINNGKTERYVHLQELSDFLSKGWSKGRVPRSKKN